MKHNKKGKDNIVDDEILSEAVSTSLKQLTDRNRNDYNDMFYTEKSILNLAADWIEDLIIKKENRINERIYFSDFSAGDGALGKVLNSRFDNIKYNAIDICPTSGCVRSKDFLSLNLNDEKESKCWKDIVGFNPPFGRGGRLAKKFINHAMTVQPKYLLVIVPVRDFVFNGYEIIKEIFLKENSFYCYDNKLPFSTASMMILLKRKEEKDLMTFITEYSGQTATKIPYVINDIPRLEIPINKNNYLLLTRKVGHYAGKQNYLISYNDNSKKYDILYKDNKGNEKIWKDIILKFDKKEKWNNEESEEKQLPWELNGHIVCIHDKSSKTVRSGLGFLKTQLQYPKELEDNEKKELLEKINTFFNENPLCFGAPKSINCAILSYVLHKILN